MSTMLENNPAIEGQKLSERPKNAEKVINWFKSVGWDNNPFTFTISPSLLVGYEEQRDAILLTTAQKHKVVLVLGPTGSGKTTLLKWMSRELDKENEIIYVSKPPERVEDFVHILNERFPSFFSKLKNIYQIPRFLEKKGKAILMVDEIHEANVEVLEWIRVLSDQLENVTLILAGMPVFEEQLTERLETLRKRVALRIVLLSLTKEDTHDLIKKRIESVGGHGEEPFTKEAINAIYEQTGGFPREVLRVCDQLVNNAMKSGAEKITPDMIEKYEEPKPVSFEFLPAKQKQVLEMLINPMTTGELADKIGHEKYRTRQHAVRSVNNILKRLMKDGYIERRKKGKIFEYLVKPELKTLVVKT